jgi:predicted secreted protein
MATPGKNASIYIGNPLAKIAELSDVSLKVSGKTIDTTNFDSSEWEEFINGTKGWSIDISGNFKHTDAPQVAAMNNILNASQAAYALEYRLTASAAPKFSGNVVTESFDVGSPVADKTSFKCTLKGSGACTFTAS